MLMTCSPNCITWSHIPTKESGEVGISVMEMGKREWGSEWHWFSQLTVLSTTSDMCSSLQLLLETANNISFAQMIEIRHITFK